MNLFFLATRPMQSFLTASNSELMQMEQADWRYVQYKNKQSQSVSVQHHVFTSLTHSQPPDTQLISSAALVSPSAYEPVPGWVDNLNGPTGLMVGAGKGVIRSMLIDTNCKSEVIPVDYAINGLLTVAFKFATEERPSEVPVYNITCADHRKVPWGVVIELSKKIGYQYPVEAGLWYPDGCITTNRFLHNINVMLFHWLPAYVIDSILFLLGQKRFMIRVQNKVQIGLEVLQFFTMRPWDFRSEMFTSVWEGLKEMDRKIFNMNMDTEEDIEEYMVSCIQGGRQYVLKESPSSLPRARMQLKMMYVLDRSCKIIATSLIFYWIYNAVTPFLNA